VTNGGAGLTTERLTLIPRSRERIRADIAQLSPEDRASVSAAWLSQLESSRTINPWIHGFTVEDRTTGTMIGQCGFKGPPDANGTVEIAYAVSPEQEGKGYATEAAIALVGYALMEGVELVRAHTLPVINASGRVLTKAGFVRVGEVVDKEDGLVWRWERQNGLSPRREWHGLGCTSGPVK
jgi:RimJ/RimL family protein N-acetyltransferase